MDPTSQSTGFSSDRTEKAKATINTISESASDFFETAKKSICTEVEEHPTRTLLVVAGLGLAIGGLWAATRYHADTSSEWTKLPRQTLDALRKLGLS